MQLLVEESRSVFSPKNNECLDLALVKSFAMEVLELYHQLVPLLVLIQHGHRKLRIFFDIVERLLKLDGLDLCALPNIVVLRR
jgi:hypothetical protein